MEYMPHIIALVSALCLVNKDWRGTAAVILCSSLFNMFALPIFTTNIADNDLYFIAGLTDSITAYLVLKFGRSGKYLQSGVLCFFVLVNAALLIELKYSPFFVYNYYVELIFALNIIQILLFWGGVRGAIRRILDVIDTADRLVANNTAPVGTGRHNGIHTNTENLEDGQ